MGGRILYGITVFVSAFLLFQVQPVIAKYILPWFGAGPGVWAVCLVFFQLVLLGGYLYAHLVVTRLPARTQAVTHVVLLGLALLTLPITPSASWKPAPGDVPATGILFVLAGSVGLPYLLLSSTGPLLQGWFARRHPGRSVYRLYALSNLGSLLGLLTYPFWFERKLRLQQQTGAWSWGYAAFVLLCAGCAWVLFRGLSADERPARPMAPDATRPQRFTDVALWFLLAACGSAFLLATTNQMCMDVAVVPFLWVVPLCVYLTTFILTFEHPRWYARPFYCALLPLAIAVSVSLLEAGVHADLRDQLIRYPLVLFVVCMCCHGELVRIKPPPERLTLFFLVVAFGGAVGGMTVALGAPHWFTGFHEYPLLLIVAFGLVLFSVARHVAGSAPLAVGTKRVVGVVFWGIASLAILYGAWRAFDIGPLLADLGASTWIDEDSGDKLIDQLRTWLATTRPVGVALPLAALVLVEVLRARRVVTGNTNALRATALVGGLGLAAVITAAGWTIVKGDREGLIDRDRNFYGVLTVREYYPYLDDHDYTLQHGRITHGYQLKRNPDWPTSYYGPNTGIGLSMAFQRDRLGSKRSLRVGVVGLGAGTMAVFPNAFIDGQAVTDAMYVHARPAPPADYLRFYEINPMVLDFARRHFTFLADAKRRGADVDVYLGDARLVMERQLREGRPERFDVLAIDAFSSDAIPIHLLTRECFETYVSHLSPMGVLAVHITNRYIDLAPVVRRLAAETKMSVVHIDSSKDPGRSVYACDWMMLTRNRRLYYALRSDTAASESDDIGPLWTDDYSSVWDLVKFEERDEDDE